MKQWIRGHRWALLAARLTMPLVGLVHATAIPRYFDFLRDLLRFIKMGGTVRFVDLYPCLFDKTSSTSVDWHYYYLSIWGLKKIISSKAQQHVDIGSLSSFVGMLTAVTDVTFVDIRPLDIELPRYHGVAGSVLDLPYEDASLHSVSCLHVIEHVGLGRYGDPVDPAGSRKACRELARVIARGGDLYVALPVGSPRVCFNAHRVHSPVQVASYFRDMQLLDFAVVDDDGKFIENAPPEKYESLSYGCGMFHFTKPV